MKIYIENYKQIQKTGENNKSAIHRLQPLMLKTALADFPIFSGYDLDVHIHSKELQR